MRKILSVALLSLAVAAMSSCASSRKVKCSCPNFRGFRSIYGLAQPAPAPHPHNDSTLIMPTDILPWR